MDLLFYLSILLFVGIFSTLDINIDFDFWARLVVGKSFFQTGTLFPFEFQSFGKTHEFIDHEWGSSLIFYLVQNNFGDIGLYIFKTLIIFLTIFTVVKIIKLQDRNAKLNFLFFFFVLQSISYNIFSTIRCQTFSFLFFVIYLYILKKASLEKNFKILWTLPILNIIWANLHGGFALGLILILLFALGEALNKNEYKDYLKTFFLTCATTLINPYGIKYIYFIFGALSLNRVHITEWQSAFFDNNYIYTMLKFKIFFFIVLAFFLFFIFKSIKKYGFKNYYLKIDKTKYLILLFTLLISLKSLRMHVFFSYALLAYCYIDFYQIFNKKLPKAIDLTKEIIIFILLLVSFISHIFEYKFINKTYPSQYPIFCVEFIKENNIKGNIFTMFHTGSYVSYKLYPNNHIFMDGRYEEVYDNDLINQMGKVFLAQDYEKFFKFYHCDILILDKSYPIVEEIKKDKNWKLAFEDKYYALFLTKEKYQTKFKQPTKNLNYYNKSKFETKINWDIK